MYVGVTAAGLILWVGGFGRSVAFEFLGCYRLI